ncbi:MAG: hypothetical protein U0514_01735 [Candidatus Andersenbacteria bacterium]
MQSAAEDADGVIVQLPPARGIDRDAVLNAVPVDRDVDGLERQPACVPGAGEPGFVPATLPGITRLLESQRELEGATAMIVGAGLLVGRPLAVLRARGATVTLLMKMPWRMCRRNAGS